VQVSGFVAPTASGPEALERARQGRGWAALLVVRLDKGAVFKSLHGFLEAGQQSWVRIHGERGLMENLRLGDTRTLRVVWDVKDGEEWRRAEEVFLPWPPECPATTADPMGDGVAETLMLRDFATAVQHRTVPDQDVYVGSSCRSPGSRPCGPASPGTSRWRFPTCVARRSAHPTRPTTGSLICRTSGRERDDHPSLMGSPPAPEGSDTLSWDVCGDCRDVPLPA